MSLKAQKIVSLFTLVVFSVLLSGCIYDSSKKEEPYCESPAPLDGVKDSDAPGYIVFFKENVVAIDEVNRLQGIYELEVWAVYDATNGFAADMSDDTREKMRCEGSVASIHYNSIATTQ